jgi:hypothetical protein
MWGNKMNRLPIADIMMLQMNQNGTSLDHSDQMRTYMFCMDMENLGYELKEEEFSEGDFIDNFVERIQKSSGFLSFASFCEVDEEGLRGLAGKVSEYVDKLKEQIDGFTGEVDIVLAEANARIEIDI